MTGFFFAAILPSQAQSSAEVGNRYCLRDRVYWRNFFTTFASSSKIHGKADSNRNIPSRRAQGRSDEGKATAGRGEQGSVEHSAGDRQSDNPRRRDRHYHSG